MGVNSRVEDLRRTAEIARARSERSRAKREYQSLKSAADARNTWRSPGSPTGNYYPLWTRDVAKTLSSTAKTLGEDSPSEDDIIYKLRSRFKRAKGQGEIKRGTKGLESLRGPAERGNFYPIASRGYSEDIKRGEHRVAKWAKRPKPEPEPIRRPEPAPRRNPEPARPEFRPIAYPRPETRPEASRIIPRDLYGASGIQAREGIGKRKDYVHSAPAPRRPLRVGVNPRQEDTVTVRPKNQPEAQRVHVYPKGSEQDRVGAPLRDEAGNLILGSLGRNDNIGGIKRKKRGTLTPATEDYMREEASWDRAKKEVAEVRGRIAETQAKHAKEVAEGAGGGFSPLFQGRLAKKQAKEMGLLEETLKSVRASRSISRKKLGIRNKRIRTMSPEEKARYNWEKSKEGKAQRNQASRANIINADLRSTPLGDKIVTASQPARTHEEEMADWERQRDAFNQGPEMHGWNERRSAYDAREKAKLLRNEEENTKAVAQHRAHASWVGKKAEFDKAYEERRIKAEAERKAYKATKDQWRRDTLEYNLGEGNLHAGTPEGDTSNWRRGDPHGAQWDHGKRTDNGAPYGSVNPKTGNRLSRREVRVKTKDLELFKDHPELMKFLRKSEKELTDIERKRGYSGFVFDDFNPQANREGMFKKYGHWDETTLKKVPKFNEVRSEFTDAEPEYDPTALTRANQAHYVHTPFPEKKPVFNMKQPVSFEGRRRESAKKLGAQIHAETGGYNRLNEQVDHHFPERDPAIREARRKYDEETKAMRKREAMEGYQRKMAQREFAGRAQRSDADNKRLVQMKKLMNNPANLTRRSIGDMDPKLKDLGMHKSESGWKSRLRGLGDWITGSGKKSLTDTMEESKNRESLIASLKNMGVPRSDPRWEATRDKRAEKGVSMNNLTRGLLEGSMVSRGAQALLEPNPNTQGTRSGARYNQAVNASGRIIDPAMDSLGGLAKNAAWGYARKAGMPVLGALGGSLGLALGAGALGAGLKYAYGKYRENQQQNKDIQAGDERDYGDTVGRINNSYDYGLRAGIRRHPLDQER
jgi:hypothetical protein